MNTKINLTEKQRAAWARTHEYIGLGHRYQVKIEGGIVEGYFNSPCGEHVSRFKFEYDPEALSPHPESHLTGHPSNFAEWPPASGWMAILGSPDPVFTPVPSFAHPNDLYQWLREEFGYHRTIIVTDH